jgi:hypothetical protein
VRVKGGENSHSQRDWKPTITLVGFFTSYDENKKAVWQGNPDRPKLTRQLSGKEDPMVVQNQNSAWVRLALFVLCMAIVFGVILVGGFGPSQKVRDEQAIVGIRATEAALGIMQTPQAAFAAQTTVAIELTAQPPAQTATAGAAQANLAVLQAAATQTKIAQDLTLNNQVAAATVTALAQGTASQNAATNTGLALTIVAVVAVCVWMISHVVIKMLLANAQHRFAEARLLHEQNQQAKVQAVQQKVQPDAVHTSIPASLMKHRGNGHDLPRAE